MINLLLYGLALYAVYAIAWNPAKKWWNKENVPNTEQGKLIWQSLKDNPDDWIMHKSYFENKVNGICISDETIIMQLMSDIGSNLKLSFRDSWALYDVVDSLRRKQNEKTKEKTMKSLRTLVVNKKSKSSSKEKE